MIKIAVFASGNGSNAENIVRYFSGNKQFSVAIIVSNKPDAFVHQRASALKIPSFTFSKQDFLQGDSLLHLLEEKEIDFIVLAGFLLKFPEKIIAKYPNRIVNIHPALLPNYGGKGMYGDHVHRAVLECGEKETGITIHYVNERYDEGEIVFQAKCPIPPDADADMVASLVHKLEYRHFPKVIEKVMKKEFFGLEDSSNDVEN